MTQKPHRRARGYRYGVGRYNVGRYNVGRYNVEKRTRRGGQALVEFAMVVTMLLLLAMGVMQLATLAVTENTLSQICREGARYAAKNTVAYPDDTQTKAYLVTVCNNTSIRYTDLSSVSVSAPSRTAGKPVTVSISYDLNKRRFIPTGFGLAIFTTPIVFSTTMTIE